jgi:hypothetical protein
LVLLLLLLGLLLGGGLAFQGADVGCCVLGRAWSVKAHGQVGAPTTTTAAATAHEKTSVLLAPVTFRSASAWVVGVRMEPLTVVV